MDTQVIMSDAKSLVEDKLVEIIATMQKMSEVEVKRFDKSRSVTDQVDMDSLATFELVVLIHEAMEASLPEDVDPEEMATVELMSDYIVSNYDESAVKRLILFDSVKIRALSEAQVDEDF